MAASNPTLSCKEVEALGQRWLANPGINVQFLMMFHDFHKHNPGFVIITPPIGFAPQFAGGGF